jgi:hypothetical protein
MKRLFLLGFIFLFLGCATTVHEKFTYGGTKDSMANGMSIYYQLEMSYMKEVEGKQIVVVQPQAIGKHIELPKTTNGFALGVYIKNTKDIEYEIWENFTLLYEKNTEPYYIKRRLEKSRLPDMVRSIDLPRQSGSEVIYKVEVVSSGGVSLFTIGEIKYSVGVN